MYMLGIPQETAAHLTLISLWINILFTERYGFTAGWLFPPASSLYADDFQLVYMQALY